MVRFGPLAAAAAIGTGMDGCGIAPALPTMDHWSVASTAELDMLTAYALAIDCFTGQPDHLWRTGALQMNTTDRGVKGSHQLSAIGIGSCGQDSQMIKLWILPGNLAVAAGMSYRWWRPEPEYRQ